MTNSTNNKLSLLGKLKAWWSNSRQNQKKTPAWVRMGGESDLDYEYRQKKAAETSSDRLSLAVAVLVLLLIATAIIWPLAQQAAKSQGAKFENERLNNEVGGFVTARDKALKDLGMCSSQKEKLTASVSSLTTDNEALKKRLEACENSPAKPEARITPKPPAKKKVDKKPPPQTATPPQRPASSPATLPVPEKKEEKEGVKPAISIADSCDLTSNGTARLKSKPAETLPPGRVIATTSIALLLMKGSNCPAWKAAKASELVDDPRDLRQTKLSCTRTNTDGSMAGLAPPFTDGECMAFMKGEK